MKKLLFASFIFIFIFSINGFTQSPGQQQKKDTIPVLRITVPYDAATWPSWNQIPVFNPPVINRWGNCIPTQGVGVPFQENRPDDWDNYPSSVYLFIRTSAGILGVSARFRGTPHKVYAGEPLSLSAWAVNGGTTPIYYIE